MRPPQRTDDIGHVDLIYATDGSGDKIYRVQRGVGNRNGKRWRPGRQDVIANEVLLELRVAVGIGAQRFKDNFSLTRNLALARRTVNRANNSQAAKFPSQA